MIENTSIQDIEINEEPIENYNGTVQIIQWKNETWLKNHKIISYI